MVNTVKDFLFELVFVQTFIFFIQVFISDKLKKHHLAKVIHSGLFGITVIVCIAFPVVVTPHFQFDMRIVPLLLGALYGGWETAIFLSVVAIIFYSLFRGMNIGFYITTVTLVFSTPVFVAFQKFFTRANEKKKIQIALALGVYYDLVGTTTSSLLQPFTLKILWTEIIQIIITFMFLSLFVVLNEMIKETLRKNQQLQAEAYETEVAFLRSQIKPHFLYNALNSIATLCKYDPDRAGELIVDLSQVLKSGFDFKQLETLTTMESELELISAYLNIEKARFGNRLSVEYDVDWDLDVWIPPLILQPLVENAVTHGLMRNLVGGTVKISIKRVQDAVVRFAVEDNGCGMSEMRREEVLRPNVTKKGIGLANISQRLKLLYGQAIRIESTEGVGTIVTFEVPMVAK